MNLGDPIPVKLNAEQAAQLAALKQKTGHAKSALLRLCVAKFLEDYGNDPEAVGRIYGEFFSKGLLSVDATPTATVKKNLKTREFVGKAKAAVIALKKKRESGGRGQ